MTLKVFNLASDLYDYSAVATNLTLIDAHDHSPGHGNQIGTAGLQAGAVTPGQLAGGAIDSTWLSPALAQSAAVNQTAQTVKGVVRINAAQSTGSASYTTLTTPDQVGGITLSTNGLLAVWYQATWQESSSSSFAGASLFLNSTQVVIAQPNAANPIPIVAFIGGTSNAAKNFPLGSSDLGLASNNGFSSNSTAYAGEVTTGQVVGGGVGAGNVPVAGPCFIFAAAGTYTVSVQFKVAAGSVTVSNRRLWVQALSFV